MSFKDFLKDRTGYIAVYFINTCLTILVMYLTISIYYREVKTVNVLYAVLISFTVLCIFIFYQYIRTKKFYDYLNRIPDAPTNLGNILNMADPITNEQQIYRKVLYSTYKLYNDTLSKYEESQKQQLYFINQWVHQMKTPVSVINLLSQEQAKENHKEILQSIMEENDKIARGLDMTLYNARLSQFNLDFKIEKVELLPMVRKVINHHKKSMIKYGVYPKVKGDEHIFVETDRKWLSFVIDQILTNAIKYSKDVLKENKYITIELKVDETRTILSIADEGIGIPQQDISRVFNAFFTGKNGRITAESTGMGMYLSKRICNELGHGLTVQSKEGKGTTFLIIFYLGKSIFNLTKS